MTEPFSNMSQLQTALRAELLRSGPIAANPPADANEDKEEVSLRQLLIILRRRALVVAGVTTLCGAGASALLLTRPPEYSGTFRLLVEPVTAGSRLADSLTADTLQTLKPLQGLDKDKNLDYISQIEVLKSETLLEPVIKRIQARYPEIDYKTLTQKLKVARPKDSKLLDFTYDGKDPEEIKFVLSELSQAFIRYSIQDRQSNLKRGLEFVDIQIRRQQQDVVSLEGKLQAFRQRNNLVNPEEYARGLADQVKTIAAQQQENRVKFAAMQTLYGTLEKRIGLPPEQALGIATLSEAPIYQSLIAKLRDLDSRLAIESARFTAESPQVMALQDQRQKLLPLLQTEAQRVLNAQSGVNANNVQAMEFQGTVGRDLTRQLIDAANQVQVLRSQAQALEQASANLTRNTQVMAGVSRAYGEIQRDLVTATASLQRLLTARENLQLETARQAAPWDLISKIDDNNIKLKAPYWLLLLMGGLASLIVGIGAALLAEQFDRAVHTVEDLKETGFPCLGTIPYNTNLNQESSLKNVGNLALEDLPEMSAGQRKSNNYNTATFLESFYSLDANIRLLSSDSPIRAITISSTSPSDGKSTVSAHLAWAAVTMGRRVLLIDTDLRRPQVHLWFGISNIRGLSNAITSDMDVRQLIQESPQDSNLHILTAGPTPPAPGRLLSSQKMHHLMEQLSKKYDLIICDAPPLLGFADAKLTAGHTDGLLVVAGLGRTNRADLEYVLDDLRNTATAPVLGMVANGVKRYTSSHYDYYHRYYQDETARSKTLLSGSKK